MTLEEKLKQFLIIMNGQERGEGLFKYFGGYWEVVYPLFQKYAPAELRRYEGTVMDEFANFNPRVRELLETGNEEQDWANSVNYYNGRMTYNNAGDSHIIEIDSSKLKDNEDDYIEYIPNVISDKENETY